MYYYKVWVRTLQTISDLIMENISQFPEPWQNPCILLNNIAVYYQYIICKTIYKKTTLGYSFVGILTRKVSRKILTCKWWDMYFIHRSASSGLANTALSNWSALWGLDSDSNRDCSTFLNRVSSSFAAFRLSAADFFFLVLIVSSSS